MSDCRFGVSPVNYPDPDPDLEMTNDTSIVCKIDQRVSIVFQYFGPS